MHIYTIKHISELGDYDEEWGQSFWAIVEESDLPVKFTKKINYTPAEGSKITAESQTIRQGKKGEFLALKTVKLQDSGTQEVTPTRLSTPKAETSPAAGSQDNKYLKDTSDLPFRVWQALLPYIDVQNMMSTKSQTDKLNSFVQNQASTLLEMIDNVRNPKEKTGYEKAKETRKSLNEDEANSFLNSLEEEDEKI